MMLLANSSKTLEGGQNPVDPGARPARRRCPEVLCGIRQQYRHSGMVPLRDAALQGTGELRKIGLLGNLVGVTCSACTLPSAVPKCKWAQVSTKRSAGTGADEDVGLQAACYADWASSSLAVRRPRSVILSRGQLGYAASAPGVTIRSTMRSQTTSCKVVASSRESVGPEREMRSDPEFAVNSGPGISRSAASLATAFTRCRNSVVGVASNASSANGLSASLSKATSPLVCSLCRAYRACHLRPVLDRM